MNEKQAKELAVELAKLYKPSYYEEPFEPHEWVVQAIIEAYDVGFTNGRLVKDW